eukprot:m.818739 g.818739  ORF g.818739 m.818739 type:complete len:90 (-) comp59388_c0_seq121:2779-3048(-)
MSSTAPNAKERRIPTKETAPIHRPQPRADSTPLFQSGVAPLAAYECATALAKREGTVIDLQHFPVDWRELGAGIQGPRHWTTIQRATHR